MSRWLQRLRAPKDAAALVVFRVALGLIVTVSAVRFLAYEWVDFFFVTPTFQFKYFGFGWVPAVGADGMHTLFVAAAVLGVMMAAGFLYRLATGALFGVFAYIQLCDVTNYLNHYYLVTLLMGLHLFIPSHRALSVDAWLRPSLRSQTLPAWCTYLLRFQVAVVYVNAGLAKLTGDWLLHAQPLNIWLSARADLPVLGAYFETRPAAYLAAWGGFLFDTTVPLFLSWRRARPFAYVVVLGFHAATALLFPIGMFPVIMVAAALVFFDPSWPRALWRRLRGGAQEAFAPLAEPEGPLRRPRLAKAAVAVGLLYCSLQVFLPLRTHLYGGNVLWHEQGMRFSWRVMAREKNGSVTFIVKDARGKEHHLPPRRYLTRLQEREMSVQPDLVLQVAHHIAREFEAKGQGPVQVFADATVSLNGRPAQRLIDPEVDLALERDSLGPKTWILPAPEGPPIHLRSIWAKK